MKRNNASIVRENAQKRQEGELPARSDGEVRDTLSASHVCHLANILIHAQLLSDSDPSDDVQSRVTSTRLPDSSHNLPPSPDTPPASQDPVPKGSSHKKTGRPATKRGRVGRNQYTKDRDLPTYSHARTGSQLDVGGVDTPITRGRSRSRSYAADTRGGTVNGINGYDHGGGSGVWGETGKPSKPRHMNPNRTSLNEMKRRVAGIMEFVSRTQGELSGRDVRTPSASERGTGSAKVEKAASIVNDGPAEVDRSPTKGTELAEGVTIGLTTLDTLPEEMSDKQFADLTSAQMIAVLTGRLVGWQKEYGVWGEK